MGWLMKLWYGLKVGLGVATKLQERGVVRIKELPKVTAVVEAIEEAIEERRR